MFMSLLIPLVGTLFVCTLDNDEICFLVEVHFDHVTFLPLMFSALGYMVGSEVSVLVHDITHMAVTWRWAMRVSD